MVGYERKAKIPVDTAVPVANPDEFLRGFKHLHSFKGPFLYRVEDEMHFDGIAKRMEDAGTLYLG